MYLNKWATVLFISSFLVSVSFGVANLIIYVYNPPICGDGAITYINMNNWILGCGISYVPLAVLYVVAFLIDVFFDFAFLPLFIFAIGTLFTTAWTIIGGITLFTTGVKCITSNFPVWQIGLGTFVAFTVYVPLSIVLFLLAFYTA